MISVSTLRRGTTLLLALPAIALAWMIVAQLFGLPGMLGADPGKVIVDHLGTWSLRILLLALSVSTLQHRGGWRQIVAVRRRVGLFAFGYVLAHFLAYALLLAGLDFQTVLGDLTRRPYIVLGSLALLGLIPLAVTSTNGWRRRLGSFWPRLHALIYVITPLAVAHLWWLRKDGYVDAFVYTVWLAVLLVERGLRALPGARAPAQNLSDDSRAVGPR